MTRRRFLQVAAPLLPVASAFAGESAPPPTPRPTKAAPPAVRPAFNWKKYSGAKIRLLTQSNHVWADIVNAKIAEFKDLTGIDVMVEILPDVRKQTSLEFSTGSSTADVFGSTLAQDGIKFLAAKYYTDLKPLLDDASLTSPEFDFADFTPRIMESARQDGVTVGIPLWSECSVLCYHKNLFKQAGVTSDPWDWTFDDMSKAAAAVRKLGADIYGVSLRGAASQVAGMWSVWLHSFGGTWLDKDGNPALTSPEALAAVETYGRMVREYGPPNSTALDWSKSREFLLQNKAAMWLDTSTLMPLDPSKFAPMERLGYTRTPAGPKGIRSPQVFSWVVAIYGGSKNKEAAWYFIQWATSPKFQLELSKKGPLPARRSVYIMPEFKAGLAASNPDFIRAAQFTLENGHGTWLPPFVNVLEARDVVGKLIQAAINGMTGEPLRQEAQKTNAELARIKRESGL